MSRRIAALKPQLNRIRAWAHEGSTDAWIAHQLETTAESVRAFRQEHGIERGGPAPLAPITPDSVVEAMLAEEAAALEAGPEPEPPAHVADEAGSEPAPARAPRRRTRKTPVEETSGEEAAESEPAGEGESEDAASDETEAPAPSTRRRSARGGAGRGSRKAPTATEPEADAEPDADDEPAAESDSDEPLGGEATGADEPVRGPRKRGRRRGRGRGNRGLEARLLPGSVLLLDPSVAADATFQEHWQGGGPLRVEISAETIVLRRAPSGDVEHERSERPPGG